MNDPREVRHAIRARRHTGLTAGLAPGRVQGNVCILPREYAEEFRAFCERNPKPCPLLALVFSRMGWSASSTTCSPAGADTVPAGRFRGKLVVSMRPFKPADAIRAIEITSRDPRVHGSPVHLGRPDLIGIAELSRPWVGDPTEVRDDELPLFWACGVTPQSVVLDAKPSLCITHAPGHMLVTDLENSSLAEH